MEQIVYIILGIFSNVYILTPVSKKHERLNLMDSTVTQRATTLSAALHFPVH